MILTPEMREALRIDVFEHNNPVPRLLDIHAQQGDGVYQVACREALAMLHEKLGIPQSRPTHFGIHVESFGYGRIACVIAPMDPIHPGQDSVAAVGSALIHPCLFAS